MNRITRPVAVTLAAALLGCVPIAQAADYTIDATHSFVQWRIQHLGFSWLYGRCNTLSGEFSENQHHEQPVQDAGHDAVDVQCVRELHDARPMWGEPVGASRWWRRHASLRA